MYNIVKVKSYLQINKKRVCLFTAKVAKTKNSGTYKNLVVATNYYNAVLQNLQNLQIPVNKINNMQYVLNAVNIATYNTNPAAPILVVALVYVALQIYFIPIHITFNI